MKNNYEGFKGWVRYVRDYKNNIENEHVYSETISEIEEYKKKLNQEIINKLLLEKEKNNLLEAKESKIKSLLTELREANIEKEHYIDEYQRATFLLKEKEKARRQTAGQVGGLKAKISTLKKDLARANQKINWLSANQKAPTKEEIIAYDTCMKEVEKKLKK